MTTRGQALLLLVFGAAVIRLAAGPALSGYVRPGTRPLVLTAAALAVGLAVVVLLRRHDDRPGSGAAALLLAPVLAVALVAPPPLGALTAQRPPSVPTRPGSGFPALRATGPVRIPLSDLVQRSVWGAAATLRGRRLLVVGFVSRLQPTGFVLSRLVITCCAADARPLDVAVTWSDEARRRGDPVVAGLHVGQWVEVRGAYAGPGPAGPLVPRFRAEDVRPAPRPADPYG